MRNPTEPKLAKWLENIQADSCCRKGCSFCCYEPAYAELGEILDMVELLTPEQREEVTENTKRWLEIVEPSGILQYDFNDRIDGEQMAFPYRRLNVPCPFLKDGQCMVYDRRPMACRTFFAHGDPKGCDKEEDRRQQPIFDPPVMLIVLLQADYQAQTGRVNLQMDHIGVVTAYALLKRKQASGAYTAAQVTGEDTEKVLRQMMLESGDTMTISQLLGE